MNCNATAKTVNFSFIQFYRTFGNCLLLVSISTLLFIDFKHVSNLRALIELMRKLSPASILKPQRHPSLIRMACSSEWSFSNRSGRDHERDQGSSGDTHAQNCIKLKKFNSRHLTARTSKVQFIGQKLNFNFSPTHG